MSTAPDRRRQRFPRCRRGRCCGRTRPRANRFLRLDPATPSTARAKAMQAGRCIGIVLVAGPAAACVPIAVAAIASIAGTAEGEASSSAPDWSTKTHPRKECPREVTVLSAARLSARSTPIGLASATDDSTRDRQTAGDHQQISIVCSSLPPYSCDFASAPVSVSGFRPYTGVMTRHS